MEPEIISKTPKYTIKYYPDFQIIHHHVVERLNGNEMYQLLTACIQTLRTKKANKWLSEDPPHMAYTKEMLEEGTLKWLSDALEAGWKYWAIIKPKNMIGQLNFELMMKMYSEKGIESRAFDDIDSAIEWLKNLPSDD